MFDILKTVVGGTIVVAAMWGLTQSDAIVYILRFTFFFFLWVVSVGATLFYDSDSHSFSYGWPENWLDWILKLVFVVIWSVVIYLAAFHGIGLDEGPWEYM